MLKLTDYANGLSIGDGKTMAYDAVRRAMADAVSYRVPLFVPPGDYMIDQTIHIPDHLEMFGCDGLSRFIHAPGLNGSVIFMEGVKEANLHNFYVSGGVGQEPPGTPDTQRLNHDSYGYFGPEAVFGGEDCNVSRVVVVKWNSIGAILCGKNLKIQDSWGRATPKASYKPDSGPTASRDFGSTFGFMTPEQSYCDGLRMIDCGVTGTRGPGTFVGGTNGAIVRYRTKDTHREYCPSNPYGFTSGGGQLALSRTLALGGAPGSQQAQKWLIDSPFVEESSGPAVSGIELDHCWGVEVRSPFVVGAMQIGVVIAEARMVRLTGGVIGATKMQGLLVSNSTYVNVATNFEWCNLAVGIRGASDHIDLRGSSYYANAATVDAEPTVTNLYQ